MTAPSQRKEYTRSRLDESAVADDPIRQFQSWFDEAVAAGVAEPNAMTLATATPAGRPSARVVLLRGVDERGFSFFTNYESRKAVEIEANPNVALVFFWPDLERQVRIEGRVDRVSEAESDSYFQGRPAGARLGAWASRQSQVVATREEFEGRLDELRSRHPTGDIPRPPNWGGYRVVPDAVEFWQGRASRLHDRLRYRKAADGGWLLERLAP